MEMLFKSKYRKHLLPHLHSCYLILKQTDEQMVFEFLSLETSFCSFPIGTCIHGNHITEHQKEFH